MKLSELIQYVNTINTLTTPGVSSAMDDTLRHILSVLTNSDNTFDMETEFHSVDESMKQVVNSLEELNKSLLQFEDKAKMLRSKAEVPALIESEQRCKDTYNYPDKSNYLLNSYWPDQKQYFTEDVLNKFHNHIKIYSSWQHAGALIRPGNGDHIEAMLSFDPLYLIDETKELLNPVKQLFNPVFQRRLRYKVLDENKSNFILDLLPPEQLGFILLNDFFNFKSITVIEQYLNELFKVLKPGGIAMFTYNNCDIVGSARNFEGGIYGYTPASLLDPIIGTIGFEILKHVNNPSINFSWMEIKKPGELTSLKGGQTLAQIVR